MVFTYKGIDIFVDVKGGGDKTLILLHGWGCNNAIFDSCKEYLSSSYKLFTFDLAGFGASDEPKFVWGTQDYVDMVKEFITANSLAKVTLMGHSFGGRVSILYASEHEVERVVLIGSAGIVPQRGWKYYYRVYSFKLLRNIVQFFLSKERAQGLINKFRSSSGSSDYNSASEMMRRVMSKVVNEDLKHVMPKICAPTLLFWGEYDTATPLSDAKTMERLIPDAGLVVAKNCGHYSFLENPKFFESVIKSFLNIT